MIVTTTKGDMDDSLLSKREYVDVDNEHERVEVIEYWLNGELVHRSPHVILKTGLGIEGQVGQVG